MARVLLVLTIRRFPRCCPARVLNWTCEKHPLEEEEEVLSGVETLPAVLPETPGLTQPEDIML